MESNFCVEDLPLPVLESILCRVPIEDILNCNLVCRSWKELICSKSFWKTYYDYHGWKWDIVLMQVEDVKETWMVLYSRIRRGAYTKNLIANPSGHRRFDGWEVRNGGDSWKVEREPAGSDPLPRDPFFESATTGLSESCFASSFGWCSKSYKIDLWEKGLTPDLLKKSLPFQIKCSEMYATRFDCAAEARWNWQVKDDQDDVVMMEHSNETARPAGRHWDTEEHAFLFRKEDADLLDRIRFVVFESKGKDTQYWAGHYGMKFARACVKLQPV